MHRVATHVTVPGVVLGEDLAAADARQRAGRGGPGRISSRRWIWPRPCRVSGAAAGCKGEGEDGQSVTHATPDGNGLVGEGQVPCA
jgi:hypothetical protein